MLLESEEQQYGIVYYELLANSSKENLIKKKLNDYFDSFGLSTFGLNVVNHWIQTATIDTTGRFHRLKAWFLQIVNESRYPKTISKWQKGCPNLLPALRSLPQWTVSLSPELHWVFQIERAFPSIKNELLRLKGQKGFQPYRAPSWASDKQATDGIGSISHDGGDWNVFYLFLHNMDFQQNRRKCPITTQLIESIPTNYQHAFFSALAPKTHVTKHHGPTNKKLRCHLPLVVPKGGGCALRVADEIIQMEEGKCFIFDDSFEHEAWNHDAHQSRIVLIIDIWHPDFDVQEIKFLQFLTKANLKREKKICQQQSKDTFYSIITEAYDTANPQAIWA